MKLRKEAIQYASTIAKYQSNMAKHNMKFFGTPLAITPEHCVSFGRIGYVTYGHRLKNKYRPRAFKCYLVGYAMNHNPHT
jgi:hypothetical protein